MTLCDILLWTDLCLLHKHLLRDVLGNMFFQQQVIENFSKTLKIYLWRNPFLGCRTTIYNFTKKTGRLINKKSIKLCKFDRVPNIMSKVIGGCFLYWIKTADNMNEKNSRYMNKNTSKIIFDFNQWLSWNFKENSSYRANSLNTFLKQ